MTRRRRPMSQGEALMWCITQVWVVIVVLGGIVWAVRGCG